MPAMPTLILSAPFAAANEYLGSAKDAATETGGIDFKNCFLFILLIFPYYRYKSNNMGIFLTSSQRFSPAVLRQYEFWRSIFTGSFAESLRLHLNIYAGGVCFFSV